MSLLLSPVSIFSENSNSDSCILQNTNLMLTQNGQTLVQIVDLQVFSQQKSNNIESFSEICQPKSLIMVQAITAQGKSQQQKHVQGSNQKDKLKFLLNTQVTFKCIYIQKPQQLMSNQQYARITAEVMIANIEVKSFIDRFNRVCFIEKGQFQNYAHKKQQKALSKGMSGFIVLQRPLQIYYFVQEQSWAIEVILPTDLKAQKSQSSHINLANITTLYQQPPTQDMQDQAVQQLLKKKQKQRVNFESELVPASRYSNQLFVYGFDLDQNRSRFIKINLITFKTQQISQNNEYSPKCYNLKTIQKQEIQAKQKQADYNSGKDKSQFRQQFTKQFCYFSESDDRLYVFGNYVEIEQPKCEKLINAETKSTLAQSKQKNKKCDSALKATSQQQQLLWSYDLQKGYWFALQMQYKDVLSVQNRSNVQANYDISFPQSPDSAKEYISCAYVSGKVLILSLKLKKLFLLQIYQSKITQIKLTVETYQQLFSLSDMSSLSEKRLKGMYVADISIPKIRSNKQRSEASTSKRRQRQNEKVILFYNEKQIFLKGYILKKEN